jgi:hypothetical protein
MRNNRLCGNSASFWFELPPTGTRTGGARKCEHWEFTQEDVRGSDAHLGKPAGFRSECTNSRTSSAKGYYAFTLMFGGENRMVMGIIITKIPQLLIRTLGKSIYKRSRWKSPDIRQLHFNARHKLQSFNPGDTVMAKDVTLTSKWHSFYVGPFEVMRRNTGGA